MAERIVLDDVDELSTATLRISIEDDGASTGTAISSANINSANVKIFLASDESLIRDVGSVTANITTGGLLTLVFTTTDNALQSTADDMPEERIILFEWTGLSSEGHTIVKNEEFSYSVIPKVGVS